MSNWNPEQLQHVADILMAAAGADQDVVKEEGAMVRAILAELNGGALPATLDERVRAFDAASFDLDLAAAALAITEASARRKLLGLVARVTESDDVHDLDESDYIVKVAKAIGATPNEYAALTVELMPSEPPPVPPEGRPSKP